MNQSAEPIDLVLLQTFYEVTRQGSVTRAAARLGRSQPAISHRLRALERQIGVELFERVGRQVQLTDYGRRLRDQCLDLMVLATGIRERVVPAAGAAEGHVTVGTLPTVVAHLLVEPIAALLRECPRLSLAFLFEFLPDLCEALRSGRADLLVVVGDIDRRGLACQRVGATELVAVMAPGDAPRRRATVAARELRRRRYLAWNGPRDPTFDVIESFVGEHGLADAFTPRIPHIESLRELAAAGAGYTILPAYTVRRELTRKRLVARRIAELATAMPFQLVLRRQQVMTPAIERVAAALRAAFAPETG